MTSTRIALLSPYALSVFGGVQEQVLAMSRELSRRGYDVLVVAPDGRDTTHYDTPARVRRFGSLLSVPANGSRAPLTLSPRAARHALQAVRDFKADLVHLHEPFAPLLGWGVLGAHEAPAVATFHRSGGGPALRLTRPLLARLSRHVDVAAAVSTAAAATLRSATPLDPVIVFNGFETERFTAPPRERPANTTIVTVGRLEERKGTGYLIRAVRAHNARGGSQWRLVIIGDGPERSTLEALAAHDDAVVFQGALGDEQKREWLRRASVVAAPATHGESFGLVVLEPMAAGVPVVASDIDGYREAASGHAVLATPGDPLALERALLSAIDLETPERIAAARAHAQRWSMRALMDEYELLYDRARERFWSAR
ncbi:MAG TPA: glycosyltransferase family 4 protein [Acidimicrobiales bacterium]|nr:glycosyltransferase family 4 protein [Acidimicrobiales bacterium]